MKNVGTIILYFKKRDKANRCLYESSNGAWSLLVPINEQTRDFDGEIEITVSAFTPRRPAPTKVQEVQP